MILSNVYSNYITIPDLPTLPFIVQEHHKLLLIRVSERSFSLQIKQGMRQLTHYTGMMSLRGTGSQPTAPVRTAAHATSRAV